MNEKLSEDTSSTRNFKLVLVQTGISTFATSMFTVLLLWMAIALTGSPFITGVVSSMLVVPLVFNFAIGAAIDNCGNKKRLAVLASLLRVLATVILLSTLAFHQIGIEESVLLISAATFGFTMDIFAPVRLVWSKSFLRKMLYLRGMSAMNVASRSARLSGYAIAGIFIAINLNYSIWAVSILYLASLMPILFLPTTRDSVTKNRRLLKSIREGLEYIVKTRTILEVIIIFMLSGFFMGMTDSTFTVEIKNFLELNSSYLGFLLSFSSAGGILGSAVSSKLKGTIGLKFTGFYTVSGVLFLLMGTFPNIYAFFILMFLAGMISGISSPIIVSTILAKAPRDKMGRIQGAMDTFGFSFNSASGVIAGSMMGILLPRFVFWVISAGLIAIALIALKFKGLQETEL